MMRPRVLLIALALILGFGLGESSAARLDVKINGDPPALPSDSAWSYVNLEGDYKNVVIQRGDDPDPGHPARVELTETGGIQHLELKNVCLRLIEGTDEESVIAFEAQLPRPTSAITYTLVASGTAKRLANGADGDVVKARGSVRLPDGKDVALKNDAGEELSKTIVTGDPGFFNARDQLSRSFQPNDLPDGYTLTGKFFFMLLDSDDRLLLPSDAGLVIGSDSVTAPAPEPTRKCTR